VTQSDYISVRGFGEVKTGSPGAPQCQLRTSRNRICETWLQWSCISDEFRYDWHGSCEGFAGNR